MAETVGSLVDKLSILDHRVYHLKEQVERADVDESHRDHCRARLEVLAVQKKDLQAELEELCRGVFSGKRHLKIYRQFKLYNDPRYRKSPKP